MRRVGWSLLVLGVAFACGEGQRGFATNDPPGFPDAGTDAPAASCVGAVRCSRDLRSVVDACDDSRVISQCAPQEGCADGQCLPACAAAVGANSSIGCEFVAVPPPWLDVAAGSCFATFVTNTWGVPTRVEAEYGGNPLDVVKSGRVVRTDGATVSYDPFSGEIAPGEVAVLFLSQKPTGASSIACPEGVVAAVASDTSLSGTTRGPTFRIKTTAPVSAYSIYPFGGAASHTPSATLLLPLSSWKNDYVVTNPWELQHSRNDEGNVVLSYRPTTTIVAAEDNTDVTVIGSVSIQGSSSVEPAGKGVATVYHLQRGEQLQFTQDDELTGTRIAAKKQISVWTGHNCMKVPHDGPYDCCCDSSQMELFPVRSWGREYAVVPYVSRRHDGLAEQYMFR
ncbi:MAG: hypothetical protein K0S65_382, partial [Labilithrix sp.]|nr:hypothetical protein [Labilithrix sp.]